MASSMLSCSRDGNALAKSTSTSTHTPMLRSEVTASRNARGAWMRISVPPGMATAYWALSSMACRTRLKDPLAKNAPPELADA